jgi:hypothetical protein
MSLDDDTLQRAKRAGKADQTRTKTASQLSLDPPKRTGGGDGFLNATSIEIGIS